MFAYLFGLAARTPRAPAGTTQTEQETGATTKASEKGTTAAATRQTEQETGATTKASEKATTAAASGKETVKGKATEKASGTGREPLKPLPPNKVYTDKCGLEGDEEDWVPYVAPPRIKNSQAAPEHVVKYRALLDQIFAPESVVGVRVLIKTWDVMDISKEVLPYLKSEPVLIEDVPFDVVIVGDLNGQVHDLFRVFDAHAKGGRPGYECAKFLFLGNYIGKGRQSVEVLMALFCLKMLYPDNFFLLRGSNEFRKMNMKNGFFYELLERYSENTSKALWFRVNEVLCWMSFAAIVGNIYFCAHGAFSPRFLTRPMLRGILKPVLASDDDILLHDLVYAEPAVGLRGTTFNAARRSVYFGLDACGKALRSIGCTAMFRGGSVIDDGFDNRWFVCFTVCSATAQHLGFNNAACVHVDSNGKLHVKVLLVNRARAERDHLLFGDGIRRIMKNWDKHDDEEEEEEEQKKDVNVEQKKDVNVEQKQKADVSVETKSGISIIVDE